ncbi:MAG TPA: hypothetical protein VI957_03035 [Candidatus Paceibacterota bacterium]
MGWTPRVVEGGQRKLDVIQGGNTAPRDPRKQHLSTGTFVREAHVDGILVSGFNHPIARFPASKFKPSKPENKK